MNASKNPASRLNQLYIVAICASLVLIGSVVALQVLHHGWSSLISKSDGKFNIAYALPFWIASGVVAGLILGKMNSVVTIINAKGWDSASALDSLIVQLSCITLPNGRVVQQQIANLLSGPAGVAVVYLISLALGAVTGNPMFGEYPDGVILMLVPFVTVWKVVENMTCRRIVRRHFKPCPAQA